MSNPTDSSVMDVSKRREELFFKSPLITCREWSGSQRSPISSFLIFKPTWHLESIKIKYIYFLTLALVSLPFAISILVLLITWSRDLLYHRARMVFFLNPIINVLIFSSDIDDVCSDTLHLDIWWVNHIYFSLLLLHAYILHLLYWCAAR